jgi:hypothetical protein
MLKTRHMWKCGCDGTCFSDIFYIFVENIYRVRHWVRSGNFELFLCYVCVGYAGQGLTEDGVTLHQNTSEYHLMCDWYTRVVHKIWCNRWYEHDAQYV